jgi:hypothetical protein
MATADAVNNIIQALNETDEQPRKQIAEIVEVLGDDVALGLLQEVRSVQDTGGLVVRDGTRQRTPGGVFFSLAKSKLPKADRNRIFRLRPPKPASEPAPAAVAPPAAPPRPRPVPVDDERRRVVEFSASPKGNAVGVGGAGSRRVVDVEILRQNPTPSPPPAPLVAVREPEPAQTQEPRRSEADARPLRRIVTLGPREEPPPTNPEAAVVRVKGLLKALSAEEQRRVLSELLADLGGAKPAPPVRGAENGASEVLPALRERVLAAVTDTLGLSTSDLARVLYGEESAGTRNKARAALERWRRKD